MLSEIVRFNKWLRRKNPHSTTPKHYTNDLELFFAWVKKTPDEVTPRDIDLYIEHCQNAQGHAMATINRRLAAIRSMYEFLALVQDEAPTNPVIPRRHYIHLGRQLPRDIEDDAVRQLFEVITAPRDIAMFMLMLRCGLRVTEVHRLSLQDLYLRPRNSHLPRLWINGKGDSHRVVYLSSQCRQALTTWLQQRPAVPTQALFVSRRGKRISVRNIQDRLTHYSHLAGVHVSCHRLRHTFARQLLESGMPVTSIQRLLGHKRIRTTQTYLHIADNLVLNDYDTAMQQIEAGFSGKEVSQ